MTIRKAPHVSLDQEMLKPRDGSKKDEGELTGGKHLVERLKKVARKVSEKRLIRRFYKYAKLKAKSLPNS